MMFPKEVLNWPVVTGCERISPGCNSCPSFWEYFDEGKDYSPVLHEPILNEPLLNPEPSTYEVAFGSDLFHNDVPLEFQRTVFETMNKADWHKFSVGTKRIARVALLHFNFKWTDNIQLTVGVESGEYAWRIDMLKGIPAKKKAVSIVPILGPFDRDIDFTGIDIVGVAPETWGYQRPHDPQWIENIRRNCFEQEITMSDNTILYSHEGNKSHAIR
jgi:protein gp37